MSAQNRGLPRPDWVLAIPARRTADGGLVIWDRTDEWTRAWRVPRVIDGMRVVTLLGDSQDSRSITPAAIDGMLVDEMQVVLDKYGAPALALIVNDGASIAVAGYVPGWQASWTSVASDLDPHVARDNSMDAIASLFDGRGNQTQPSQASTALEILAYRQNPSTGGLDYRILIRGDQSGAQAALDIMAGIPNGNVIDVVRSEAGYVVVVERFAGAQPFEYDLQAYGLLP